jgi:hypothetical protein
MPDIDTTKERIKSKDEPVPHFEKVTQIKTDYSAATPIGGQNGVNHERKKAVTRQVRSRYRKAGRKEKSAIPDEFISITGYKNRKCAMCLPNKPAQAQALLFVRERVHQPCRHRLAP